MQWIFPGKRIQDVLLIIEGNDEASRGINPHEARLSKITFLTQELRVYRVIQGMDCFKEFEHSWT
jgi:hypothetical protein